VNRICKQRGCDEEAEILGFGKIDTGQDSWFCLKHWMRQGSKYDAWCSAKESKDEELFKLSLDRARNWRDTAPVGQTRKAWARAVIAMQTINERWYRRMRQMELGDHE